MDNKRGCILITALFPLFIGGLIYLCFRSENILFFSWLRFVDFDYSFFRQINLKSTAMSSYIVYNLPHGLWVLSGLLLLRVVAESKILVFYSIVFIVISIGLELAQLFGMRSGTFDLLDLITIVVFSSIGLFVNNFIGRKKYAKV